MKKSYQIIFIIGLIVIGFIVGYVISKHVQFEIFELEKKINPVELITLIITIFLGIYIPSILTNRLNNKQHIKNTIIRRIELVQDSYSSINGDVGQCINKANPNITSKEYHTIVRKFLILSNQIKSLQTLLEQCNSKSLKEDSELLKKGRKKYKDCVTGGAFSVGSRYNAITIKDENLFFSEIQEHLGLLIFKIHDW